MLAQVLDLPRLNLYLNFERVLSEEELGRVRAMVRRRAAREPLQHILGSTSFCGLEIKCSAAALIPRPETELLAEHGWQFLNTRGAGPPTALDVGTGTGCIAIALAVKAPNAIVHAVDVSAEALALAAKNAAVHGATERIVFHEGDMFNPLPAGFVFDLIVSNPPYIPSAEIETLEPEVRNFDPRRALDGGVAGLDFYHRMAHEAPSRLRAGGRIMVEFGDGQAEALSELFSSEKWIVDEIAADYSARPRFLIARPGD